MPTPHLKSQWIILQRLLKFGILWGLIAAALGLSLGYALAGQTLRAAYYGLNWASLAMFMLSGVFIAGQVRGEPLDQMRFSRAFTTAPNEPVPWERIIVCVVAGLFCAGLVFAMMPLLEK